MYLCCSSVYYTICIYCMMIVISWNNINCGYVWHDIEYDNLLIVSIYFVIKSNKIIIHLCDAYLFHAINTYMLFILCMLLFYILWNKYVMYFMLFILCPVKYVRNMSCEICPVKYIILCMQYIHHTCYLCYVLWNMQYIHVILYPVK